MEKEVRGNSQEVVRDKLVVRDELYDALTLHDKFNFEGVFDACPYENDVIPKD